MLGVAGSGKSYFSRQLAKRIDAVRINADAFRYSVAETIGAKPEDTPKEITIAATDWALRAVLDSGHNIVFYVQHKKHSNRMSTMSIAASAEAKAVLIWVQTPTEIAIERATNREEAPDQRKRSHAAIRKLVERQLSEIEKPKADESYIEIDGTISFEDQFDSFEQQLKRF